MVFFFSGDAREISLFKAWSTPGDVELSITLQNLHSTDIEFGHVKYIHNYTNVIHLQHPVLDDLAEAALTHWFTSDGESKN